MLFSYFTGLLYLWWGTQGSTDQTASLALHTAALLDLDIWTYCTQYFQSYTGTWHSPLDLMDQSQDAMRSHQNNICNGKNKA